MVCCAIPLRTVLYCTVRTESYRVPPTVSYGAVLRHATPCPALPQHGSSFPGEEAAAQPVASPAAAKVALRCAAFPGLMSGKQERGSAGGGAGARTRRAPVREPAARKGSRAAAASSLVGPRAPTQRGDSRWDGDLHAFAHVPQDQMATGS